MIPENHSSQQERCLK